MNEYPITLELLQTVKQYATEEEKLFMIKET